MPKNKDTLLRFGFSFRKGGTHLARTMMLSDLKTLLAYADNPVAEKTVYQRAIEEENCLGKRSGKTRTLSYNHLVELYALNPSILLVRALLFFWKRDLAGQPLLALLCAYARDPILRLTAPFILKYQTGSIVLREDLVSFINDIEPDRFSRATLKSTSQNINSTWTQSGHLTGCVKKIRSSPVVTAGNVSYALMLGYLTGARGESLFNTEYANLLSCSFEKAVELAEESSRKGWIVFKRVGQIIDVSFPNLINKQEMEWILEQN